MTNKTPQASAEEQARRLEAMSEELTRRLREPDVAARMRAAPGEAEWSVMQVLGHLTETIPYWLGQCQALIAADEPPTFGRGLEAPDRLAGPARGTTANAAELMDQWQAIAARAAQTIRQMPASARASRGRHVRRGEMTVAEVVEEFMVAHAENHLAQVEAALGREAGQDTAT